MTLAMAKATETREEEASPEWAPGSETASASEGSRREGDGSGTTRVPPSSKGGAQGGGEGLDGPAEPRHTGRQSPREGARGQEPRVGVGGPQHRPRRGHGQERPNQRAHSMGAPCAHARGQRAEEGKCLVAWPLRL